MSDDYESFTRSKIKDPAEILSQLDWRKIDLIHMTIGISGEAGELLDAIKKHVIYNKDLDTSNIIEELGDIEFYLQGLRNTLNIDRDYVIEANRAKLDRRYIDGYSDKAAQERKDKL